jgi:hypothetical protein
MLPAIAALRAVTAALASLPCCSLALARAYRSLIEGMMSGSLSLRFPFTANPTGSAVYTIGTSRAIRTGIARSIAIAFRWRSTGNKFFISDRLSSGKKNGKKQKEKLWHVLV